MMKVTREEFLGSDAEETMDVLRARVELFDEVIQFLRDENAKLQEDVVTHALNNGMLVKCVTDRNDALKELVLEMHQTMVDRCNGSHEPYHGKPCSSCAEAGSADCPKVIAERMRELGIEVPDD